MATVTQSYFHLLTDHDGDIVVSRRTPTPSPAIAKKNNKRQQAAAAAKKKLQTKPHAVVAQDHETIKELVIDGFDRRRPKQKLINVEAVMQNNQQKEQAIETKLTLKEYEKGLVEKKKALNALWKPVEERKANLDKDFESMKLVHQKKDDEHVVANTKKKDGQHKEAKVDDKCKLVVDNNGFLNPQRIGSKKLTVAANGVMAKLKAETTLNFEDVLQFPALK